MAQVKLGNVILVFCWAHVRRDFIDVGKGWDELKVKNRPSRFRRNSGLA